MEDMPLCFGTGAFYIWEVVMNKNNKQYWIDLSQEINDYCDKNKLNYKNYFYHEELVKAKKENKT